MNIFLITEKLFFLFFFSQQRNFSPSETNLIMIVSLEKGNNPLHELSPLSFIQQRLDLSSD